MLKHKETNKNNIKLYSILYFLNNFYKHGKTIGPY